MADVHLGLIGAGSWGRNFFRTIHELPNVSLTRLASRNPDIRKLLPPDCIVDSNWRAVAQAKDLDGVIIAAPPALHAKMATAAIEAGLAVFLEKPLTLDVGQAEMLGELVERYNGHLLVDHTQLFNPAFIALKRAVKFLKPITSIHSFAGNWGPFRTDVSVLWDWGPHDVAMCLDLLGGVPKNVAARRIVGKKGYGETIEITLSFSSQVTALINLSNNLKRKTRTFQIQCDTGDLLFDDFADHKVSCNYKGDSSQKHAVDEALKHSLELPLTAAVRNFTENIRAKNYRYNHLESSIDVVRTLARCQRSLEE